jgi:hypothetical protein
METGAASNKWWAMQDARMRNYAMGSSYSEAEKNRAERMRLGLELVYYNREIHINYRKNFIAVKIERPEVRDRRSLALLEKDYEMMGVEKRVTAQGVIYRIPRI